MNQDLDKFIRMVHNAKSRNIKSINMDVDFLNRVVDAVNQLGGPIVIKSVPDNIQVDSGKF